MRKRMEKENEKRSSVNEERGTEDEEILVRMGIIRVR
jgi:hypothetical protein